MPQVTAAGLSIVIPALNEGDGLSRLLDDLASMRRDGAEVVVADGGSTDGTPAGAAGRADRVVVSSPGRARQMNAGARAASGNRLWFLHADSSPPPDAPALIDWALSRRPWGRFDVRLSGGGLRLGIIAAAMNRRSCWTGIATGDQGIFVWRAGFESLNGFPDQPLMEDIAFSRLAKRRLGWPACVPGPLETSSRRWERNGIARTVLLMWRLRLAYALGAAPDSLHRRYYAAPSRREVDDDG